MPSREREKLEESVGNEWLMVKIDARRGPIQLFSPKTGFTYSDHGYLYRLRDEWQVPSFESITFSRGTDSVTAELKGFLGKLQIRQVFTAPEGRPYIEERISVENRGSTAQETPGFAMGFARSLGTEEAARALAGCRLVAVPFRRGLIDRRGEYWDFSFEDVEKNVGSFSPRWPEIRETPELGAEGWVWTGPGGTLLIAKHSPSLIEHSVLSVEDTSKGKVLRFGGSSLWHGDPEEVSIIASGERVDLSTTRYILVEGGWKDAYYAFRDYMEEMGHGVPDGYNPPVHWNELYDNPLWWSQDTWSNRQKLYTLSHMEEEAEKAREIGCEALYLDPGWDTCFGSSIWPPYRLLRAEKFVALMQKKYGLGVSLHLPLAVWCDPTTYPLSAHRMDERGNMLPSLCGSSRQYLEEKTKRLLELAEAGFVFFMFDGTAFTGECWDRSHGHSIPLKRSEHCRSILRLAREVHSRHPEILIELHDPILGGVPYRYCPIHYLHGYEGSFDEVWAFEYMWDPMEDLLSGRAISLFYYNLAYSFPLYIHIDLRKDNENALEFWWYASTCRHLGIGGRHPDEKVWRAHKRAMKTYMRLKRFFTRGVFTGLEEEVHVHHLPGESTLVVNVFNLSSKAAAKRIELDLEQLGYTKANDVSEGEWSQKGKLLSITLDLAPRDAKVLEVQVD